MLYIALEPAVRARWPHSIVTWNRVLAGRWQDPLVAGHVLVGALAGAAIAYFFFGMQRLNASRALFAATANADAGLDARAWIGNLAVISWEALQAGLLITFAIFCLRAICRKDWIASVVAAFLFTLRESEVWRSQDIGTFLAYAGIITALAFLLLRLGLVSTVVAVFFLNMLLRTPAPQDLTKWYEWSVIAYPVLGLALVAWAFWRTSGEQALAVE
jgi:serine/threonine-protein kinase